MKVTLLVLALNEIDGMKAVMPLIDPAWCDQIIVVDGGSTDGTAQWARDQGYDVHEQQQKGIRFAYLEILQKIEGDVVITFSPDGNCPTEGIPQLIEKMSAGYDMVIASRYLDDAKSDDDDFITAFGNWLFTKTINLLHGGKYTDAMVIYRAFKTQLIYDLKLNDVSSYTLPEKLFKTIISWEPLMSVRAARNKCHVSEIPMDEPKRIAGKRKLQILRWGGAYYFQFFLEFFKGLSRANSA